MKKQYIIPLILICIIFSLYSFTSSRTVAFGDSGEFVCAAYNLGVLHPPGYPLYTILGKVFTLLPLGNPAYEVNIMSAFFGSLSILFLYFTIYFLTKNHSASIISCISMALGLAFWTYSTYAKGYTLNLFFLSLLMFCAVKYRESNRYIYLFAFVFGLSCTYHFQSMIILLPAFIYLFLSYRRPLLKELGISFLLFILPLILYLFIPLRVIQTPDAYHWGDPSTVKGFFEMITGKIYGWEESSSKHSLNDMFLNLSIYCKLLVREFNPLALLLSFYGLIILFKKDKRICIFTFLIYFINVMAVSYLIITQITFFREAVITGFYLPSHLIIAFWISSGFLNISEKAGKFGYLLFIIPVISLALNFPLCNQRNNYIAYDFAKNCLSTMPENSILITSGDNDTFPLWYLQQVEHFRTDVKVVAMGLIQEPYYEKYLKNSLKLNCSEDIRALSQEETTLRLINKNTGFKIYLTYFGAAKLSALLLFSPRGILYEVAPLKEKDLELCSELIHEKYNMRGITDKKLYKDFLTSSMIEPYAKAYLDIGLLYLEENNTGQAVKYFNEIYKLDFGVREDARKGFVSSVDLEMAKIAASSEEWDNVLKLLDGKEEELKNNPYFYLTRGCAYRGKKMYKEAFADMSLAINLWPKSAKVYLEVAKLYYDMGDLQNALYKCVTALQYDEKLPTGHYWLGKIYEKNKLKDKAAKEYILEIQYNNYQPAVEALRNVL